MPNVSNYRCCTFNYSPRVARDPAWRDHKLANIAKHTLAAASNFRLVPADTGSLVEQSAGTHKSK